MAATSKITKPPVCRTMLRLADVVRQKNTEQAVNLLLYHPLEVQGGIIRTVGDFLPSSDSTIRNVLNALYFVNGSTSDDHMVQAAVLALNFETTVCVMNILRESHPLLQAVKQRDVSRVQTLLQQQPREETLRLITKGPDIKSLNMQTLRLKIIEQVISALMSNYTMSPKLNLVGLMRDFFRRYNDIELPTVCPLLATPADTSIEVIQLVFDSFASTSQFPEFSMNSSIPIIFGTAIAANKLEAALILTQTMLDKIPESLRQTACLNWLIICVSGGVCGEEVISLLLKSLKYDDIVENMIVGFLFNAWAGEIDEKVLLAIMNIIPRDRSAKVLTCNFDPNKCPLSLDEWREYFEIYRGSLLNVALSSGNMEYVRQLLTLKHFEGPDSVIQGSSDTVQTEMLALCQPYLRDFVIPDHQNAKLQMHAVVCYNDFDGLTESQRHGADLEAEAMTEALKTIGVNMQNAIKNWSTYSLFQGISEFCETIQNQCSLAVVCVMTHGKAGQLIACQEQKESTTGICKINDLLYILGEKLPHHVPKVLIVQACQGLKKRIDSNNGGPTSLDAAAETDAARAKSGRDDYTNVHVEMKIPNTTLLISTLYGTDAHRNHFIPALAEEIKNADGVRTVHDMFTAASHNMMSNSEEKYQRQIPEYRTSNRQILIIPKRVTEKDPQASRVVDNHREDPGPSTEAQRREMDNKQSSSST